VIRSLLRPSAPIAVQGDSAGPTLILASTSSSHASGAPSKPSACSQIHESACSDPQLCPAVPRHPDTLTARPSISSVPVMWPSGTTASSLVRGSGARYSTGGRRGRNGGCSPVSTRSQRALWSPIAACPRNWPSPATVCGGKAGRTCLITDGRGPRSRSTTVHHRATDSGPWRGRWRVWRIHSARGEAGSRALTNHDSYPLAFTRPS